MDFMLSIYVSGAVAIGLILGVAAHRAATSKRMGDADELARRIVEEARKEAQEIRERAMSDITAEALRVKDDIHRAIIEISSDMANKIITASVNKEMHDKLFDDALTELEDAVFRPLQV